MRCPACNGKGEFFHYGKDTDVKCNLCDGYGQVKYIESKREHDSCLKCNNTGKLKEEKYKGGYKTLSGTQIGGEKYIKETTCQKCGGKGYTLGKMIHYYQPDNSKPNGCFITTATLSKLKKTDDCEELNTFREFRDKWLIHQDGGEEMIAQYYIIAPLIVAEIDRNNDAEEIYLEIWNGFLSQCLVSIKKHNYEVAKNIYIKLVEYLQSRFIEHQK